jgi:hypothetical protein
LLIQQKPVYELFSIQSKARKMRDVATTVTNDIKKAGEIIKQLGWETDNYALHLQVAQLIADARDKEELKNHFGYGASKPPIRNAVEVRKLKDKKARNEKAKDGKRTFAPSPMSGLDPVTEARKNPRRPMLPDRVMMPIAVVAPPARPRRPSAKTAPIEKPSKAKRPRSRAR